MKFLLDTHTLIWWASDDTKLSLKARKAMKARASTLYVSAASAYEMAYKFNIGKAPKVQALLRDLQNLMAEHGLEPLPITLEHGRRAGELDGAHRDPWDRILAAQAIVEDLAIISNDEKLSELGAKRFW
ncbi:MAG TPA: type II toxin-antitoxin system VapC family toxin [Caulobacterales bacterium]|nr:type II toxin-antitoxin system VapC family toxin [Caulobacterales bacterium]